MSRWDDEWDRPWEDKIRHIPRGNQKAQDDKLAELRRAANANLRELYANKDKLKPEPKRKQREVDRATAFDIEMGHIVREFRELRKIETRYARRKHLTKDEQAHWEELDARLDTLREAMNPYDRNELNRFVRMVNKAEKIGILQNGR